MPHYLVGPMDQIEDITHITAKDQKEAVEQYCEEFSILNDLYKGETIEIGVVLFSNVNIYDIEPQTTPLITKSTSSRV